MSTNDINKEAEKLEELKQYATDLGITFRENIGIAKLELKIQEKEEEIAAEKRKEKAKAQEAKSKKVKVIIEPRERDAGVNDQFFGFNSLATGLKESILIQFGEEVEISEAMYNHIKNITFSTKKSKMVPDADGIPQKQWYNKVQTRFIISKV